MSKENFAYHSVDVFRQLLSFRNNDLPAALRLAPGSPTLDFFFKTGWISRTRVGFGRVDTLSSGRFCPAFRRRRGTPPSPVIPKDPSCFSARGQHRAPLLGPRTSGPIEESKSREVRRRESETSGKCPAAANENRSPGRNAPEGAGGLTIPPGNPEGQSINVSVAGISASLSEPLTLPPTSEIA
jgi:hypothetical protein